MDFLNAILCITENGRKWRALPKEYGDWRVVYVRMNRWRKNGTLDKVFTVLREENVIDVQTEYVRIDSAPVKVRPDGAGDMKANGEQSIGRSKGGLQPRFIWLPRLPKAR